MATIDFTSLLVIVTPKQDRVEATFAYPENANRCWTEIVSADHTDGEGLIGRKSGKASSSATPTVHLHLHLTLEPQDLLKGFVFGTDKNTCDVLLGRSRSSGISGNHFSVHIDWASGNPVISCLTGRGIRLKEESTKQQMRTLSRDDAQIIPPGSTFLVEIIDAFELTVSCPNRGELQSTYNEKLKEYYGRYIDAVPDMGNVTLSQTDLTPFISCYYVGMNGGMYGTIHRMTTGDAEYDSKVFLYNTQRIPAATENERTAEPGSEPIPEPLPPPRGKQPEGHPTHRATALLQDEVAGPETTIFPFSDSEKSQVYVVKHFRDVRGRWDTPRSMAEMMNRVEHSNILRVVDFISTETEFMVVNEFFLPTTLDSILRDAARLSTVESGFIMGQVLEGLKYLHNKGWTHGNLDPRSILVMARDLLFVKVADFALSGKADLGKPIGYHSDYASQKIPDKNDQYPMDIWSAGVVGLQLLEGVLPARSGYTLDRQRDYVVTLETHAKLLSRTRTDDNGLRFLTRVLQSKPQYRPTATALLQDSWIQDTKNYDVFQSPTSQSLTPQSSRHASVGPSGCNANDELNKEDGSEKAESSEKVESVKSQGPVKKKARRAPAVPSSGASSRPQGKKPALRRSGRHTEA